MTDPQIEKLAKGLTKGLTKAQREQTVRLADVWRLPDLRVMPSLVKKGIAKQTGKKYGYALTPLGLALRAHIAKENGHD
jgi:hypothetical protein